MALQLFAGEVMGTFERAFEDAERAASAGVKAAVALTAAAKLLLKATKEGDIGKVRRATEKLRTVTEASKQDIANAIAAWPFTPEQDQEFLRDGYEAELIAEAKKLGLIIHKRDDRLVAFPSLIRILPKDSAVQVNRKRLTNIRPSRLVAMLIASQNQTPRWAPERFVETLFSAYRLVVGSNEIGKIASLYRIYEVLTILPGSAREYSPSEFSRDLYLLDRSGVARTKGGYRLKLPAATGTKSGQKNFSFITPEGSLITYFGISFSTGQS
jgi:hypothetical protein